MTWRQRQEKFWYDTEYKRKIEMDYTTDPYYDNGPEDAEAFNYAPAFEGEGTDWYFDGEWWVGSGEWGA